MVIVRLSTGLANQVYEYAAAYAAAKERHTELVLDISECMKSPKGFLLDYFNIPNVTKIAYAPVDAENLGHAQIGGVPDDLLEGKIILTDLNIKSEKHHVRQYRNLQQLKSVAEDKDIYMCGYFMGKEQYVGRHWKILQSNLVLRNSNVEIEAFKKEIADKNTVGIHIRRGDFLYENWPEKMSDNYYRAAVVLLEVILKKPYFYVFSDDIEYAKQLLGNKKNIKFIHFTGYQDADLSEFVCLSLCRHKIISNSSTFSRLADELGNITDRILVKKAERYIRWKNNTIELPDWAADYLAYFYFLRKNNVINRGRNQLCNDLGENELLKKIAVLTIDSYGVSPDGWEKLSLIKMKGLIHKRDWTAVLQTAFPIYYKYRGDRRYDTMLIKALTKIGAYEEAIVESVRTGIGPLPDVGDLYGKLAKMQRGKYIIVPFCKSMAASFPAELIEMGIILSHLGNEVLYIFEPVNESEEKYIENNQYFINHKGIIMGGRQISCRKVSETGLDLFLADEKNNEVVNYMISRKPEFLLHAGSNGYVGIFYDYSYEYDAERKYADDSIVKECVEHADYVISHDMELKENDNKYIYVEMPKEENIIEDGRWDICRENRMSRRYIHIVAELGGVL